MRNGPRVSITDVARHASVSKATVSRVLNNKPDVDEATRNRVLAVIEELGYTPSSLAVGLTRGRTNLIGLLVPSLSSSYSLEVVQGVAEAIEETPYELVLFTTTMAANNQARFAQVLSQQLTDGLVVLLPRSGLEQLSRLRTSRFPVVLVDHRASASGFPSVTASNFHGACDATAYLLQLGHQRIGFITGLMDFGASRDRLAGYKSALEAHGIPFDANLVVSGDFTEAGGFAAGQELFRRPDAVTAVFASNDEMAFGVLDAARKVGLKVPDDLSIIGFDNVPTAARAVPPLTTVEQPLRAMGRRAVEMLVQQIDGQPLDTRQVELPTRLITRESCSQLQSAAPSEARNDAAGVIAPD